MEMKKIFKQYNKFNKQMLIYKNQLNKGIKYKNK